MSQFSQGIVRIATCSPSVRVGDVAYNAGEIQRGLRENTPKGVSVTVFPELSLTGYTCGDLFTQTRLLESVEKTLLELAQETKKHGWAIVGAPLRHRGRLYNTLAVLADGKIAGVVPKIWLPNSREYYEQRWFCSGARTSGESLSLQGHTIPFGPDLLFASGNVPPFILGLEVCEDLWSVSPPSEALAMAGATVIANGSASNEILGKVHYRRQLVQQQSARCLAAYAYSSSGPGESTTDLVFSGHAMICENGTFLAETERFKTDRQTAIGDIDLQQIQHERLTYNTFFQTTPDKSYRQITVPLPENPCPGDPPVLHRPLSPTPFVPSDPRQREDNCREIFSIQKTGLLKRLQHIGTQKVVLGISGGLDSTLALLVCIAAFDEAGFSRKGILAPTMPGLGTTDRTRKNAEQLVSLLGARLSIIPIANAVREHFASIGHDGKTFDITYENAQARERTQILMDLANKEGGICVGTGDLSESALGWCTFNGDHMSMYHVNVGIPKTLVRYLIEWCAEEAFPGEIGKILHDIIDTPITPELLPKGENGELEQITEEKVGPYRLHDFFLYYLIRHGLPPRKVLYLAALAFREEFTPSTIQHWLKIFITRFFRQQFKRSSMPDGPKVGTVALSPRGDWRMPSDACPDEWLRDLEGDLEK